MSKFQAAVTIYVQKNCYDSTFAKNNIAFWYEGGNGFLIETNQTFFFSLNKIKEVLTLQTLPTRERIVLSDVPLSCDISRKKK